MADSLFLRRETTYQILRLPMREEFAMRLATSVKPVKPVKPDASGIYTEPLQGFRLVFSNRIW